MIFIRITAVENFWPADYLFKIKMTVLTHKCQVKVVKFHSQLNLDLISILRLIHYILSISSNLK